MRTRNLILLFLILPFAFSLLLASDADAIPAFARRYNLSCSTCHAPFPKLKPYGDDFAGNGFIIPENERSGTMSPPAMICCG